MNSHWSKKLITLLTPCVAVVVTVVVTIPQSPTSAVAGGGVPGLPRRAAAVIAAGAEHTCTRLSDGSVKCWGRNDHGQLGQGDTVNRGFEVGTMGDDLPPVDLGTGRTALAVAAGIGHTCALLDDHMVKCWGSNVSGQLGQGDTADRGDGPGELGDNLAAIDLGTGRTATAIASGGYHNCAILDDASVKCWGYDNFGELGLGYFEITGDEAGEMGDTLPAIDLGTGRTATAIAAGLAHTCAILDDGTAKCWGANTHGELGQGDTDHRGNNDDMGDTLPAIDLGTGRTAAAISAGIAHTCALLDDYSLKCWGSNDLGQLGQGDTEAARRRVRRDGRCAAPDRPRWWVRLRRGRSWESFVRRHVPRQREVLGSQQLRPARPGEQPRAGRQRRRDGRRPRPRRPRNRAVGHRSKRGERSFMRTARRPDDEVLGSQRLGPARQDPGR